jgi:hypothetical protein
MSYEIIGILGTVSFVDNSALSTAASSITAWSGLSDFSSSALVAVGKRPSARSPDTPSTR